ncbi:MAG: hypothetical protein JXA90_13205 [Planctomycetes bacterium]|nr:hypothetical protein [Planctomycetota bacterium]
MSPGNLPLLAVLAFIAVSVASCAGSPGEREPGAGPHPSEPATPAEKLARPLEEAVDPFVQDLPPLGDETADASRRPAAPPDSLLESETGVAAGISPQAGGTAVDASFRGPVRPRLWRDLVGQAAAELRARWKASAGEETGALTAQGGDDPGEDDGGAPAAGASRQQERRALAASLIALEFLHPGGGEQALEAVDALRLADAPRVDELLLAAAGLARLGRAQERDALLVEIISRTVFSSLASPGSAGWPSGTQAGSADAQPSGLAGPPPADPPLEPLEPVAPPAAGTLPQPPEPVPHRAAGAERGFRLEEVAIVNDIQGEGTYTRRKDHRFQPGERLLVYGELAGFRESVEIDAQGPVYQSRFAGSLRLLDASGELVAQKLFLRPEAGAAQSREPRRSINFWARYRLSDTLAPGRYEVEIEAEDIEGARAATSRLSLEIVAPPAQDDAAEADGRLPTSNIPAPSHP